MESPRYAGAGSSFVQTDWYRVSLITMRMCHLIVSFAAREVGCREARSTQKIGLAIDSSEISGALSSETLNEPDLAAGRYDAATVELWLTDWTEPELSVLLAKGVLGEVKREVSSFYG